MKTEPLKGKIQIPFATGYMEHYHFKRIDIRLAIEWLKEELWKDARKASNKDCEGGVWEQDGIIWAIEKIDKAFPDIVKKVKVKEIQTKTSKTKFRKTLRKLSKASLANRPPLRKRIKGEI